MGAGSLMLAGVGVYDKAVEVKALQEQGLTLRQIGDRFGVSRTTVSKWLERARPTCRGEGCGWILREATVDGLCGFCREEAVRALAAGQPTRTYAVWNLRELGHTSEAVIRALRAALEGVAVGEIVASLMEAA